MLFYKLYWVSRDDDEDGDAEDDEGALLLLWVLSYKLYWVSIPPRAHNLSL